MGFRTSWSTNAGGRSSCLGNQSNQSLNTIDESVCSTSNLRTSSEFKDIQAYCLPLNNGTSMEKINIEAEKVKLA